MADALEKIYQIKEEISAGFSSYDKFAEWLLKEQESAKRSGGMFVA